MVWLALWLICGVGSAWLASTKRRSAPAWFLWGVLLGPLGLLLIGFAGPVQKTAVLQEQRTDNSPPFFQETARRGAAPVHVGTPESFDPPRPNRALRARARVLVRKSELMREAETRRLRSEVRSGGTRRLRQCG